MVVLDYLLLLLEPSAHEVPGLLHLLDGFCALSMCHDVNRPVLGDLGHLPSEPRLEIHLCKCGVSSQTSLTFNVCIKFKIINNHFFLRA